VSGFTAVWRGGGEKLAGRFTRVEGDSEGANDGVGYYVDKSHEGERKSDGPGKETEEVADAKNKGGGQELVAVSDGVDALTGADDCITSVSVVMTNDMVILLIHISG